MNKDLGPNQQLSVMALGIVGEFGEIVEVHEDPNNAEKIAEEAGDIFFYIANTCTQLNIDWRILFQVTHPEFDDLRPLNKAVIDGVIHAAAVADVIKKTVGQGHVLDIDKLYAHLKRLVESLLSILHHFDKDLGKVLEGNEKKLAKRYKNGFSTERSVNREV